MLRAFFKTYNSKFRNTFLAGCLLLVGCQPKTQPHEAVAESAPAISTTITDARGQQITFPRTPRHLLPLSEAQAEWLYAYGAEDRIAARPKGLEQPPYILYKPAIELDSLDSTALKKHKIDAVLMRNNQVGDFPKLVELCQQLQIPVIVQRFTDMRGIGREMQQLGALVDARAQADTLQQRFEHYFRDLQLATLGKTRYQTIIVLQLEPLVVVGGGHHLSQLLGLTGARNPYAYDKAPYLVISPDSLVARDPDFIYLPRTDFNVMNSFLASDSSFLQLRAVRERRVFAYDPRQFLVPGPKLVFAAEELVAALHPEADVVNLYQKHFPEQRTRNTSIDDEDERRLY